MGSVTRRAAAIALFLVLGVAGCDYFRPAVPESGNQNTAIIPNYRQQDSTLATLARGIADKGTSNGLAAYIGGFADSTDDGREFHAFFDPRVLNRLAQRGISPPPEGWDRNHEEQDFYPIFVTLPTVPSGSEYVMQWIKDPRPGEDDYGSDTAVLYREYRVYSILSGDTQTIAHGYAALYFVRVGSKWVITRWDDTEVDGADLAGGEVSLGQRRLEH